MRLNGMFTNHRLDDYTLTDFDFTTYADNELQELESSAHSKQYSLSCFETSHQQDPAHSSSQLPDANRRQASSASWNSLESCSMPRSMTNEITVLGSSLSLSHSGTDEALMIKLQTTQECLATEFAMPQEQVLASAPSGHSLECNTTANTTPSKKRLSCRHPGCKETFPRNWELQRHTKHKHDKSVDYHCFVYGCNRTSKPVGRLDKFREHWRKHHKTFQKLICIFGDCVRGPFLLHEFQEHIQEQHAALTPQEDHWNEILKTVSLRRLPYTPASTRLGNLDDCPLALLGCDFRFGNKKDPRWSPLYNHLEKHNLVERSLGYDVIMLSKSYWPHTGVAHCPICEQKWDSTSTLNDVVFRHVAAHTRKSRSPRLEELYIMFQPYFLGKESFYISDARNGLTVLQSEIEEAGLIPASTTPTND